MSAIKLNTPISVAFFGSHNFAARVLEGLLSNSPFFCIKLIITQPDKPVGRHQLITTTPIKTLGKANNITIIQPRNLQNISIDLSDIDLNIVAQYGKLIPLEIINAPSYGTINIHTSLLPKYRGASPIQSALMAGDKKTGVTIMQMDEGLDSGPIIYQTTLDIMPNETYPELEKRLITLSSQALSRVLPKYLDGQIKPIKQAEAKASYCARLNRTDGKINWRKSAQDIFNQYRGLYPWPGIWTTIKNRRLKLLRIKTSNKNYHPGKMIFNGDKIHIGTAAGAIEVLELQLEGKKVMTAAKFINGHKNYNNFVIE